MIIKRKLYSFIGEERIFGEVKRANKAAKKAAHKKAGTGITVSQDEINEMRERIEGSNLSKRLDELKGRKRPVYTDAEIKEIAKTKKAKEAGRSISDKFEIMNGKKQKLNFDELSRNGNREVREAKLRSYKRRRDLVTELEKIERSGAEREAKRAAEKKAEELAKNAAKLRASRVKKASELRAKKAFAKNAKIGAGIVAGSAALGTGAYLYKKSKNKNSDSK